MGWGCQEAATMFKLKGQSLNIYGRFSPATTFHCCRMSFYPILVASVPVSSETLRFDRYRDRDLSRLQNFQDVETETQRDSRIWRMSRPRLIETKKFRGCRDRDSSRLKNLEDVETETDRDSPKGVETETESLATHCTCPILTKV